MKNGTKPGKMGCLGQRLSGTWAGYGGVVGLCIDLNWKFVQRMIRVSGNGWKAVYLGEMS